MVELTDLPGTFGHRRMLHAIASYYEADPRILAIGVFGSLGRGNWDGYSDIDLDVVIEESVELKLDKELERLCTHLLSIDEHIVLIIPDGSDAADLVFRSLMELSIRYHCLSTTSPDIVDTLQLISGRIDRSAIAAAGRANQRPDVEPLGTKLDRCIRYALEVESALHRGQIWAAIELLHYIRGLIMELFSRTHHGQRTYQFFQKEAGKELQAQLGHTLPLYDLRTAQMCLNQILELLTHDLNSFTGQQVQLTNAQSELLASITIRQKDLTF